MKNMKLKRILGISSIMLVGLGISIPIALTTSCSGSVDSVDLTFTSKADFNNYFEAHHDEYDESLSSDSDSKTIFEYFITSHRISAANMLYSDMSEMDFPKLLEKATNDNPLKLKINVGDSDARFEITKDFYIDTDDTRSTYKAGTFYEHSINDKVIVSHAKMIYSLTHKNSSAEYNYERNTTITNNVDINAGLSQGSTSFYLSLRSVNNDEIDFELPKDWYPNITFSNLY